MKIALNHALRAVVAIAALLVLSVVITTSASAQDDPNFDVKVMSPAGGAAGELPLNYIVNFTDGTSAPGAINAEGLYTFPTPIGADVQSVVYNGQTILAGGPAVAVPWAGGCWRWCIKCRFWPWWRLRCYIIIYWDPCCP